MLFVKLLLPEGTLAFPVPWPDTLGIKSLAFNNTTRGHLLFLNSCTLNNTEIHLIATGLGVRKN